MVIKPLEEDSTPGTAKPFQVSLVEPVAYQFQLQIENRSSEDVCIQSGDIVKGGRQDRVLTTDLVLPSHSGKLPIASFCVEHGRWTRRGNEAAGQFSTSTQSVSFKSLKLAVRNDKDQGKVWAEVANAQESLAVNSGARPVAASPTSMQLALENRPCL